MDYTPTGSPALKKIKSDKHRAFLIEYFHLRNATKAYMRAYPTASYATARAKGSLLVSKDNIKQALAEMDEEFWENRQQMRGETLGVVHNLATSDINDIVDYDPVKGLVVKDFKDIDTRVIQSLKQTEVENKDGVTRVVDVKLHPKTTALAQKLNVLKMTDPREKLDVNIEIIPAEILNEKSDKKDKEG